MIRAGIALASLGIAAGASAQAGAPIGIRVSLDQYDAEHGKFTGNVIVSATVCRSVDYNVRVPFGGAKDAAEARKQTAATVARLVAAIREGAAHCG